MKLITWGLIVVGFCYLSYAGMMSVWSYFQVAGAVDEALEARALTERHDPLAVKQSILNTVNQSGVPLQERDVAVTASERALRVDVVWSFPVVIYKGESVLAVPLSVTRSRAQAEAR